MKQLRLFLCLCFLMNTYLLRAEDIYKPLENKTVLIVYGGWGRHAPKDFSKKISPWLIEQGAKVIFSDSLGVYTQKEIMDEVDLILQSWTMGKISGPQARGLVDAIKNGAGIAGCHGGTGDSFRNNVAYQYMIGGQWVAHPGNQIEYTVNITNDHDPITAGLHDFNIQSEQYYMHVDPNVEVLATTTFNGEHDHWIDGAVMPVVWKKQFGEGRVFYYSIGHNMSDLDITDSWAILTRGILWASNSKTSTKKSPVKPVYPNSLVMPQAVELLDKELSAWDIFMGVPHTSVQLEGYEKSSDVRKGKPIGLNKDPKNVFSVVEEDGENILKITGEIYAALVTKNEYSNYHLTWQFKWGDKKWEPRLDAKRNSGVLYHSIGQNTDLWNVWMTSLECEVQETDCGDYISIANMKAKCPAEKKGDVYYFKPGAELVEFEWGIGHMSGRCFKHGNPEKEHGHWNTMDIYCYGNTSVHVLNGVVVMVVVDPVTKISGSWEPFNKGKIQIQSEAAEIYYKNIEIRSILQLPEKIAIEAGL